VSASFGHCEPANVDKRLEIRESRPDRQEARKIKHIVANRVYKSVESRPARVGVLEIEETVIEDTPVFVDPSLLTNQRTRGQDVIDPYQASQQARLGNQPRWRVITSESDSEA
jgi:hypothetical protein